METVKAARSFCQVLRENQIDLKRRSLSTVQVNLGRLCNQACHHCHVEAGPKRTEIMTLATVNRLLGLMAGSPGVQRVDLTGGAPELNPHFRHLVSSARAMGKKVIDRCNLTVFFEAGQEETPDFLKYYQVEVVASLPCYSDENVNRQRGNGVFAKSIRALKLLNNLGYGRTGTGLVLNLVYNPGGAFLPPEQTALENEYRHKLREKFGIEFNGLFTITNMPIRRFLKDLRRTGKLEDYMSLLVNSFNPKAAREVMCRDLVSVSWDGFLFDCDFNQMLDLPLSGRKRSLWEIDNLEQLAPDPIALADHCFGCSSGAGSSCGGALT